VKMVEGEREGFSAELVGGGGISAGGGGGGSEHGGGSRSRGVLGRFRRRRRAGERVAVCSAPASG
jgi:hypothetical protein